MPSPREVLRFLLPSAIGAFFFLFPLKIGDSWLIPIAAVVRVANEAFGEGTVYAVVASCVLSAVCTLVAKMGIFRRLSESQNLQSVLDVGWHWVLVRIVGAVFCVFILTGTGPEFIISDQTGSFMLYNLLASILAIAIIAGAILPLLVEFGLMELVGTLLGPLFRPLFSVPGRAAVDCLSSWVGNTTVSVLLTNQQYGNGYYTTREACVIATMFSTVSITFALVVIEQAGLIDLFFPFYGIVCITGVACAVIVPRLPPLSWKADQYIAGPAPGVRDKDRFNRALLRRGVERAITRANSNGYTLRKYLEDWQRFSFTILLSLTPVVLVVGTLSLALVHYTPIFEWLGLPFLPLLELLQVPEARAVSAATMAGFSDMFIPVIMAAGTVEADFPRLLVAVLSITQVIFLSETASMILASRIPLNFAELFAIFIERTVVSLVVASLLIRWLLPSLV